MNAADTRGRILMTAMELFWEKGYLSTSVSDILSRSQVHSGSLYHFFPGKQDVLVGVLELYRDGIDEMLLAPNWEGVDDPVELYVGDRLIARGQLEELDGDQAGQLAVRLTEVASGHDGL